MEETKTMTEVNSYNNLWKFLLKKGDKRPAVSFVKAGDTFHTQDYNPKSNYGILGGIKNDLIIIDIDCYNKIKDEDGNETIWDWDDEGKDREEQLEKPYDGVITDELMDNCKHVVETGNGGLHLYYKYTERLPTIAEAVNGGCVDIRSEGGYGVCAGSVVNGKKYKILRWDSNSHFDPMPEELIKVLEKKKPKKENKKIKLNVIVEDKGDDKDKDNTTDFKELLNCIDKSAVENRDTYIRIISAGYNLGIEYEIIDEFCKECPKYDKKKNMLDWLSIETGTRPPTKKAGWKTMVELAEAGNPELYSQYKQRKAREYEEENGCCVIKPDIDVAVEKLEVKYKDSVIKGTNDIYATTKEKRLVGFNSEPKLFNTYLSSFIRDMKFMAQDEQGNHYKLWTSTGRRKDVVETWIDTIQMRTEVRDIEREVNENEQRYLGFTNGVWDCVEGQFIKDKFVLHFGELNPEFNENYNTTEKAEEKVLDPIFLTGEKGHEQQKYWLRWVARGLFHKQDKTFGWITGLRDSGKSVLNNALKCAFPASVKSFNANCLLTKQFAQNDTAEMGWLIPLKGCGICVGTEISVSEKYKLNGELIKNICSGEEMVGRLKFQNDATFNFTGRMMIGVNTIPSCSQQDTKEKFDVFSCNNKFTTQAEKNKYPNNENWKVGDPTINDWIRSDEGIDALRVAILMNYRDEKPIKPRCMIDEEGLMAQDEGESELDTVNNLIEASEKERLLISELKEKLMMETGNDWTSTKINKIMTLIGHHKKKLVKNERCNKKGYGYVGIRLKTECLINTEDIDTEDIDTEDC